MFISQIYATERVQAGNEILVNYGPSYCEQFITWNCINDLTNEMKPPVVIGELSTVMFSLASASVPRTVRGETFSTHLVARIDSPTIQRIRDILCSTDTGANCARQEAHRAERHSRGRGSPASMMTRRRQEPDRPSFAKWLGRRSSKRDATASGLLSTNPICGRGLSRAFFENSLPRESESLQLARMVATTDPSFRGICGYEIGHSCQQSHVVH